MQSISPRLHPFPCLLADEAQLSAGLADGQVQPKMHLSQNVSAAKQTWLFSLPGEHQGKDEDGWSCHPLSRHPKNPKVKQDAGLLVPHLAKRIRFHSCMTFGYGVSESAFTKLCKVATACRKMERTRVELRFSGQTSLLHQAMNDQAYFLALRGILRTRSILKLYRCNLRTAFCPRLLRRFASTIELSQEVFTPTPGGKVLTAQDTLGQCIPWRASMATSSAKHILV